VPKISNFIENDPDLYKTLSLVELLRMGKLREQEFAMTQLKKIL
jgi:hypothetical protein